LLTFPKRTDFAFAGIRGTSLIDRLGLHGDRKCAGRSPPGTGSLRRPCYLASEELVRSHSRPRVSNDNAYSESQFRTLKYAPSFPGRFGSLEDARSWYNNQDRHSGIGHLTPAAVHTGQAPAIPEHRAVTLQAAYAAHPDRFVHGTPEPPPLPVAAWINRPDARSEASLNNSETEVSHGA